MPGDGFGVVSGPDHRSDIDLAGGIIMARRRSTGEEAFDMHNP